MRTVLSFIQLSLRLPTHINLQSAHRTLLHIVVSAAC